MYPKTAISFLLASLFVINLFGQADDPVLFTINERPVHVSEFKYIYSKTNTDKVDYSKKSLEEYLGLYTNFKLKVEKAREMELDKVPALQQELEGYRRQLANSYLIDKQVKGKLLKEAYKRKKEDREISHILIPVKPDAPSEAVERAYNQAMKLKKELDGGADFAEMARKFSGDQYSAKAGGKMGYINALLPNGFYEMETAAYETPVGKHSAPARTIMGYHIVKVDAKRPAIGTIEVAQILIRVPKGQDAEAVKPKIEAAYKTLESGITWDNVVGQFSEDEKTKKRGGQLGFWKLNSTSPTLLNAAFGISKDGAYSKPVLTSAGWHILKRISKPKLQAYDVEKGRLQTQVERDDRFREAREVFLKKVKTEAGYTLNEKTWTSFLGTLDKNFNTYKWKAPKPSGETLYTLGDKTVSLGSFTDFLARNARFRATFGRRNTPIRVAEEMIAQFSDTQALDYEKSQLEKKYPDFKSLMREYQEGILLFEITKTEVWDKASKDTIGLKTHFEANKSKYKYEERAEVIEYTVKTQSKKLLKKARKTAKKKGAAAVASKINKKGKLLTFSEKVLDKTRLVKLGITKLKKGAISTNQLNDDNSTTFYAVKEVIAPRQKTLKEAKGFVVADYQEELEKEWIRTLRKKYAVKLNQEVFDGLVQ